MGAEAPDGPWRSARPASFELQSNSGVSVRSFFPSRLGVALAVTFATLGSGVTRADEADLARAEQLISERRYQEASSMLAPIADSNGQNASFNYLAGRAALGSGQPEKARVLLAQSLATDPDSVPCLLYTSHRQWHRALFFLLNVF